MNSDYFTAGLNYLESNLNEMDEATILLHLDYACRAKDESMLLKILKILKDFSKTPYKKPTLIFDVNNYISKTELILDLICNQLSNFATLSCFDEKQLVFLRKRIIEEKLENLLDEKPVKAAYLIWHLDLLKVENVWENNTALLIKITYDPVKHTSIFYNLANDNYSTYSAKEVRDKVGEMVLQIGKWHPLKENWTREVITKGTMQNEMLDYLALGLINTKNSVYQEQLICNMKLKTTQVKNEVAWFMQKYAATVLQLPAEKELFFSFSDKWTGSLGELLFTCKNTIH